MGGGLLHSRLLHSCVLMSLPLFHLQVRRPIAADHSCLFNSVGYAMHQSKSRAPFLRRVVSNEVSGDPDTWSSAFLGMPNAAYCAWINEPQNWGGGIELGTTVVGEPARRCSSSNAPAWGPVVAPPGLVLLALRHEHAPTTCCHRMLPLSPCSAALSHSHPGVPLPA
jgi:hypothetical protein